MEAFNFRIIKTANGAEIIDSTLSTPYSALTPMQMIDYINVEILTFLGQQSARKSMSVADTYRAGVKANIREYIEFKNLFESYNIQIVTDDNKLENPIGKVAPSRELLRMAKNNTELLELIIKTIKAIDWTGSEKSAFTLRLFQIFKKLFANYEKNTVIEGLLENCKGASYFENKIAPVKSNAEMYDILAKAICE